MKNDLVIRDATAADSARLSRMLLAQRKAYIAHFTPFAFTVKDLSSTLSSVKKDRYWLLFSGKALAGLFMLRGFDAGYETPSFGVVISEQYSGLGLSALALSYSVSWCATNGVGRVMLKVHPQNLRARRIYENFGFVPSGLDPKNENVVMCRKLKRSAR